jgi:hypothetical protein
MSRDNDMWEVRQSDILVVKDGETLVDKVSDTLVVGDGETVVDKVSDTLVYRGGETLVDRDGHTWVDTNSDMLVDRDSDILVLWFSNYVGHGSPDNAQNTPMDILLLGSAMKRLKNPNLSWLGGW